MEGQGTSASGGHWGPRVTEASRRGKFGMHEWGDGEGMGDMHRGIGVREGDVARDELFSRGVGSAERGLMDGAYNWKCMSRVELLAGRGG